MEEHFILEVKDVNGEIIKTLIEGRPQLVSTLAYLKDVYKIVQIQTLGELTSLDCFRELVCYTKIHQEDMELGV